MSRAFFIFNTIVLIRIGFKCIKMSRLILCLSLILLKSCSSVDNKSSFVFDSESIFTAEQKTQFDSLFRGHEKRTSNEIVIVTTPNYSPDSNIVFYSVNFLRNHGIGKKI
jgi:uncharacterized membrane protein YgcG